ncbi:MAG: hypothetical protein LBG93_04045 [Treponema sp.]|nr:hypothetical protein [Treponema sp.]
MTTGTIQADKYKSGAAVPSTETANIADESLGMSFVRVFASPRTRIPALRCVASIFKNFFFAQYRAAFLPGRIPVSSVDHPLDGKIPFTPGKVGIYLDFVAFWIRSLGFIMRTYGRQADEIAKTFIQTMGSTYEWAAAIYQKHLSTTVRPFYIANPRFLPIHGLDPHLMCIPSLHVMVVIRTYTFFRKAFSQLGGQNTEARTEELYRGAIAITEAVLFIKQHSVNCIPAAMYAMTKFDPALFPEAEAERFTSQLFLTEKHPSAADAEEIRRHILVLYRRFAAEGEKTADWRKPLLDFLREMPPAAS